MRKIKINWNLIIVLLAIIMLIVTVLEISNQNNLDLLNSRIEDLKSENQNLKDQSDPSWHKKFNEQKEYFDNRIAQKDSQMINLNSMLDSVIHSQDIVRKNNKNQYVFNSDQLDTIGIALLKGLEYRELLFNSYEIIDHKDSIINVYATYINNNREDWNILSFNITQIILLFVVLILIVSIIIKTKKYKVKPNENQN